MEIYLKRFFKIVAVRYTVEMRQRGNAEFQAEIKPYLKHDGNIFHVYFKI